MRCEQILAWRTEGTYEAFQHMQRICTNELLLGYFEGWLGVLAEFGGFL